MDFIKKKIIARSIVASIMPITLYSAAFGLSKIAGSDFEYTNKYAWMGIALISVLYPLNQLGLFLLFKPLQILFESKIIAARKAKGQDKKPNPILIGNFGPVEKEQSYEVVKIVGGKIPTDISGVYLRNGPNAKFIPENKGHHWFDGDAMVHAMRIKNGQLYYCNRWIQCPRYQMEDAAGKAIVTRVGEMSYKAGLMKMILQQLEILVGYCHDMSRLTYSSPNTAFAHHEKNTYALVESNYPYKIKVDQQEKSFDIKSVGHETFDGQLKHNVSAHPKVNAKTGEFSCFGYNMEKPYVHYTLFDKDRKLINQLDVEITSMRMIHDFPITDNYVIFPDLPLEFKPDVAMKEGGFVFKFDQKQPARYAIMKKNCQSQSQVQWFTLPTHYTFHFLNAWEGTNKDGQAVITLFGCAQEYVDIALEKEHPFFEDAEFKIKLTKYTFNLVTGEADMKYLVDDISLEFPVINQQYVGQKTRYAWISYLFQKLPDSQVGKENLYFQGFIKYDMQEEKIIKKLNFGATKTAGEVFFSPRDGATEEDDGYCMSFVYDWATKKSEFVMWDAKTMDETPVLRAETQERVPNGFHTFFVPESQLAH